MANFFHQVKLSAKNMGKVVKDKTDEVSALVKINKEMNDKKIEIDKAKHSIGQAVYDDFQSGKNIDSTYVGNCKKIKTAESRVTELKVELLNYKGIKKCVKCSNELALDMVYCYHCGAKQPEIKEDGAV